MVLDIRKNQSVSPPSLVHMEAGLRVRLEQMPRQLFGGYSLEISIGDKEPKKIVLEAEQDIFEAIESSTEEVFKSFLKEMVEKIKGG